MTPNKDPPWDATEVCEQVLLGSHYHHHWLSNSPEHTQCEILSKVGWAVSSVFLITSAAAAISSLLSSNSYQATTKVCELKSTRTLTHCAKTLTQNAVQKLWHKILCKNFDTKYCAKTFTHNIVQKLWHAILCKMLIFCDNRLFSIVTSSHPPVGSHTSPLTTSGCWVLTLLTHLTSSSSCDHFLFYYFELPWFCWVVSGHIMMHQLYICHIRFFSYLCPIFTFKPGDSWPKGGN